MVINKSSTVCFSGYKPEKFPFSLEEEKGEGYPQFKRRVYDAIYEALEMGHRTFLCGMSKGFDLFCGLALHDIRMYDGFPGLGYRNIKLIAVMPFCGHRLSGYWGKRHDAVMGFSDGAIFVSKTRFHSGYNQKRDLFLVDNSSHLIGYWDGRKAGGIPLAGKMALRAGHSICNVTKPIGHCKAD